MIGSTIVFLIFFLIIIFLKNRYLTVLLFSPLFIYFLTYDIRNSSEVNDLLIFKKINSYTNYILYGISILLTIIVLIFIDNELKIKFKKHKLYITIYNLFKLKSFFYLTSILAIIGTIINLSHVNFSFVLLFISPRDYELTFGSSTFVNYLYFLSPISICLFLFLKHLKCQIKFGTLIVIILFFSSFLHGVKFTVFDTVLIPAFFYFYLNKFKVSIRIPLIIVSILLLFYWSFSTFVRGSEDSDKSPLDQVISYVLPNYVNLAYSLNDKTFQWDGFSIFLPDKSPSLLSTFYVLSEDGFVLNEAYNMQTAYINYFRFAWYFGPLLFLFPTLILRRYLISKGTFNLSNLFFLTLIDFSLLFVFFFHAFIKTKYWFFVLVIILIHSFSKTNKSVIINE